MKKSKRMVSWLFAGVGAAIVSALIPYMLPSNGDAQNSINKPEGSRNILQITEQGVNIGTIDGPVHITIDDGTFETKPTVKTKKEQPISEAETTIQHFAPGSRNTTVNQAPNSVNVEGNMTINNHPSQVEKTH